MSCKRVCIIGAGPSGLTAIKTCLEEGLEPVCFEKTSTFGGLWRYRDQVEEGVPSVMKSTIINSSKEMSCFSDFPPPAHFANYMHNRYLVEYFHMYAEKFNLLKHIHYNTPVIQVIPSKGYDFTGKWTVKYQDKEKEIKEETFDGVMICIGHHVFPHIPTFPGMESFKGNVIHTHSYKVPEGFEDKHVVVIGIGNSALDAAVELSRSAKQVYLSTRRGAWVSNRVDVGGIPLDTNFITRFWSTMKYISPQSFIDSYYEMKLNMRFDHAEYRLKPKHGPFAQHITINDELPNRLISGTVIVKDDIQRFTETGVYFKHDPKEYPIDAVILATGYKICFPFISDDIINVEDNKVNLYKYVFPPDLQQPTLAVIGLIQPLGSIMPISEIQARWITKVFKREVKLPTKSGMKNEIKETRKTLEKKFVASPRHTIQVDYQQYMDEIASIIGAKPSLWSIFFSDPQLFFHCFFGPVYPYQYRLNGPHPWPGATNAILTARKRILAPLHNRSQETKLIGFQWMMSMILGFISFIGVIILGFFTL